MNWGKTESLGEVCEFGSVRAEFDELPANAALAEHLGWPEVLVGSEGEPFALIGVAEREGATRLVFKHTCEGRGEWQAIEWLGPFSLEFVTGWAAAQSASID